MAVALLVCSASSAQTLDRLPGFDLERLDTNMGRGSMLVGNGELMVPEGLNINLLGHYERLPLVLNDGTNNVQVVSDRATSLLSASYGLLSWLEVGAQVPFVLWQKGQSPGNLGFSELSAQGLGTPLLQARLGILSRQRRQPVDLSADLGVGLPVGTPLALAGDTGPRFQARMTVGLVLGWLQPSIEAGALFRPSIRLVAPGNPQVSTGASSEIRLGAALTTTGKGLRGEVAWRGVFSPQLATSMEVMGGVRIPLLQGLESFAMAGPGFGRAPGTPLLRALVGVSYRNEPPPKISYLDAHADRELQLTLATPEQAVDVQGPVRPTADWEMRLGRGAQGALDDGGVAQSLPRPFQPNPGEQIVLRGDLPFARGSAELPGVVSLLDQAVLRLAEQAQAGTILIQGHADTEGRDANDTVLSLRRAQAVRLYLIAQGVPSSRIRLRALGSDWPVSARPVSEGEHQLNRRAEVIVITEVSAPLDPRTPTP